MTKKTISINNINKIILTAVMAVIGFAMVFPFLWMISSSLKTGGEVFNYPIEWIPKVLHFENYSTVWNNEYYPFFQLYFNSAKVALISIVLMLVISSMAAYSFSKISFPGRDAIFLLFLATMMIPSQSMMISRYIIFYVLGLNNTHMALIVANLVNILPPFLLRQSFVSIPVELSESARIDGANHFTILTRIIAPLAKPTYVSLLILTFVWFWNDYENPLIFLKSRALYTIPLGLQVYRDDNVAEYQLIMAGATLAIIPILVVFMIFQKYFIQGIAHSGIKG